MKKILILPLLLITFISSAQNTTIGNPIKFNDLEVSQFTFQNSMNWNDAIKACEALGVGWKLPSKDQLNTLYKNKENISGFVNDAYWSSTNNGDYEAWRQYFSDGDQVLTQKQAVGYVRAIRELKMESNNVSQSTLPEKSKSEKEIDAEIAAFLDQSDVGGVESGETVKQFKWNNGIPFVGTVDSKSDKRYYTQKELTELHKPAYIIGTPIKVGKFIVAQHEFPVKYIWKNAKAICATLGPGWRLPTKEELYILYQNKNKIGNFSKYGYWSSSTGNQEGVAWHQDFYLGGTKPSIANKNSPWGVRAVKSQ